MRETKSCKDSQAVNAGCPKRILTADVASLNLCSELSNPRSGRGSSTDITAYFGLSAEEEEHCLKGTEESYE